MVAARMMVVVIAAVVMFEKRDVETRSNALES